VDGVLVEVQVIEEWGYDLGDDACLLIDDRESEAALSDNEAAQCDPEVDRLVEDFADRLAEEAGSALHQEGSTLQATKTFDNRLSNERHVFSSPVLQPARDLTPVSSDSCGNREDRIPVFFESC
jgi:hypothetical protein